jgi:hypothetical protein
MKRLFAFMCAIGLTMTMAVFVAGSRSQASDGPHGCSVESVRGSYGFHREGATPGGPLAAVGIVNYDGKGNSSFAQTIVKNGVQTADLFTDPPIIATYTVDSNCSAKFIDGDGNVFGHAVVVDGGDELYFMSLSNANTIDGVMKRIRR